MDHGPDAVEHHQAEAVRLRSEIEELVRQARLLLRGEVAPAPALHKPVALVRRAERERELENCLEKADWFKRDIKRLRQELQNRDRASGAPNDGRDRDPMELRNLLAERRQELQRLQRSGDGLDRVLQAQRRAEAEQNALRPEVQDKLAGMKKEVEAEKRKNAKLQAERLRLSAARKAAEEELRAAGNQLRSRAAQLQRPPRPPQAVRTASPPVAAGGSEPRALRQLRQNIDILREALRQDERRFTAAEKEYCQEVEFAAKNLACLRESVAKREAEVAKLHAQLPQQQPQQLLEQPSAHELQAE